MEFSKAVQLFDLTNDADTIGRLFGALCLGEQEQAERGAFGPAVPMGPMGTQEDGRQKWHAGDALVSASTFSLLYQAWIENQMALEASTFADARILADAHESLLKISPVFKTDRGNGRILLTQNRSRLLHLITIEPYTCT